MSSSKAKRAKASRNNAAREARAQRPRLITGDMLTAPGNVPRSQANELADLLDPTVRDLADMEYAMQLGDPEGHEPLIGCPLSIGGLVSSSVKVRTTQMATFEANAAGDAFFVCYQHLKVPVDGDQDTGGGERIPTRHPSGSETNRCLLAAHSVAAGSSLTPLTEEVPGVSTYGGVYVVPTGVSLPQTDGRMVAQSFKVQPNSSALTTSGTGMMVRVPDVTYEVTSIANTARSSLAGLTPEVAYALQNAERSSAALPNWDPDHWFTTNMLPKQIESVSFGECAPLDSAWSDVDRRARPGAGYAAFFAFGCNPGQTFVAEITTIFEIKGSHFAYATPNAPQSSEMDVVAHAIGPTGPGVHSNADISAKGLLTAAAHAAQAKGPSLGARFVSKFVKMVPAAKASWARLKGTMKGLFSSGGKIASATLPLLLAAAPAMMKANRRAGSVRLTLGTVRPNGLPRHSLTRPSPTRVELPRTSAEDSSSSEEPVRIKTLAPNETPLRIGSPEGKKDYHFLYENFKGSRADLNGDFRVHDSFCSLCSSGNWVLMVDKLEAVFDAASETVKAPARDTHRASPELEYARRDQELARSGRREHMVHWPSTVGDSGELTTFQCDTDCKMCLSGLVRISGDELTFWCHDHEGIISMNLKARSAHLKCLSQLADATRLAEFADATEKSGN